MYFSSADKNLFITGVGMMVAFLLLLTAAQCPDFLIAGVIMDMFFQPAYQVPVCIIAAILRRVLVLLYPADQLR
jgi:hypothetical protein